MLSNKNYFLFLIVLLLGASYTNKLHSQESDSFENLKEEEITKIRLAITRRLILCLVLWGMLF